MIWYNGIISGGGKIINIGSGYSLAAAGGNAPYAASKAGFWNMMRSMALDWGKDSIQVNLIVPGWIVTEMTTNVLDELCGSSSSYPSHMGRNTVIPKTPAGRIGEPEDLAGTAVFLASKASDFMTGSYVRVDGGISAGDMAWPPSRDE